jgi:tRNA-dihydrouridine synthase B
MAGVTDVVFRSICKRLGADVMVTEFVSSEGIIRQDERTRKYTEFTDDQRPVGVQLFGADGNRMGEAARKIIDWKQPDFIDINFGCPVNKVVSRNGGSSLLKDCSVLASVASEVARAVGEQVPVTAKIRIGWDSQSINAPEICTILENCGMQAISVHGRTRSQGYGGEANWDVIDECSRRIAIPVIGNGDLNSGQDIRKRRESTGVSGVMIGRSAMQNPWIFREARHYLQTGEQLPPVPITERWRLIVSHCRLAIASNRYGNERQSMLAMRSRLMTYCKGFPGAKPLRRRLSTIASLMEIEEVAAEHMEHLQAGSGKPAAI